MQLKPGDLRLPDRKDVAIESKPDATGNTLELTVTFSPEFAKELYTEEKLTLTFGVPGLSSASLVCRIRK